MSTLTKNLRSSRTGAQIQQDKNRPGRGAHDMSPRRGQLRRNVACASVMLMLAASGAAPARSQDAETSACDSAASDAERIACLEAQNAALSARIEALESMAAATSPPAEETSSNAAQADATDAATPAPGQAASAASPQPDEAAAAETPRRRFGLRLPRPPAIFGGDEADEAPDAPARETAASADADALGAEQVARRESVLISDRDSSEDARTVHAMIVDYEVQRRGRLVVTLDNGQVWRQTEITSHPLRLNETEPTPVEIRRSGFGGYRLQVGDQLPVIKVERLQ
jgi:hypothetical protein